MKRTTIVVTGGRDYLDVPRLWRVLDHIDNFLAPNGIGLVVEGASDDVTGPYVGADYWAHQWALARNRPTARHHAMWKEKGRSAGPIRNGEMLAEHIPDLLIEFPGGNGTANMVEQAHRFGTKVLTIADLPLTSTQSQKS